MRDNGLVPSNPNRATGPLDADLLMSCSKGTIGTAEVVGGWGAAVFFFGMGVVALALPERIVGTFGGKAPTPQSRTEVRAVYGGFGLGAGALTAYGLVSTRPEAAGWLQGLGVAMASMAFGRVLGAMVERGQALYPTWAFVGVECGLALALWAAGGVFGR